MTEIPFGPTGQTVYERTYSRTKANGEKETWPDTTRRVAEGNLSLVYGPRKDWSEAVEAEYGELVSYMDRFALLPAGRHLWASGVKGRQYLFNCHVSGWGEKLSRHFEFTFLRLMEGGGVGANYSSRFLEPYGAPRRELDVHVVCDPAHQDYEDMKAAGLLSTEYDSDWAGAFEVEDSREGWAAALVDLIDTFMTEGEVKHRARVYDVSRVRPKGSRLKTFGGTASGPGPFARMMSQVGQVLSEASETPDDAYHFWHLSPVDAMEIDHAIAECVVSGGVRRSARMAICHWNDPFIAEFLYCKEDGSKHWTTNISVEIDDEFLEALNDTDHQLNYEAASVHGQVVKGMLRNGEPGYWNSTYSNEGETGTVVATNPCQPSWAPVLTPNGVSTIWGVSVGDTIWSEDGWVQVLDKWSTGVKPVYRYHTTAGYVDATENHRVVERGIKVELEHAEGIDRLRGPKVESRHELVPQAVADGLVLGDGYLHKASNLKPFLCVGAKDQDYYESEIADLFTGQENGTYGRGIETTLTEPEMSTRVFDRRIPERYLYGGQGTLASFLRGLYSANGSICGGRVTLKTTSIGLVRDVQIALSSLGMASYYTTNKPSKIQWPNGTFESRESYDVNIGRVDDIREFSRLVGFIQRYKTDKLAEALGSRKGSNQKELCSSIRQVEYLGNHEVFDMTVSGPSHTYWSGGHNVSNCGEIALESWENCNLGHVNLDAFAATEKEGPIDFTGLVRAHELMTRFLIRATYGDVTDAGQAEKLTANRRIGVGHLGVQGFLAKYGIRYSEAPKSDGFKALLETLYGTVRNEARQYAFKLRIPEPVKVTTVAPTGTIAKLPGVSEGIHPIYARHFLRRVRFSMTDPEQAANVAKWEFEGYQVEPDVYDKSGNTYVVTFPTKDKLASEVEAMGYPVDMVESADELSLEQLLAFQAMYQEAWADNAVSFTANVPEGLDLEETARVVQKWLPKLKGTTIMVDGTREQAPYQRITAEEFAGYEVTQVEDSTDEECSTGACPVR